ncbi:MAG: hypothetical protein FWD01_04250, partial [Defluviitaleaceae bacterium]|nr:hypothetical protein [Defluviitaleaceae bacterium]
GHVGWVMLDRSPGLNVTGASWSGPFGIVDDNANVIADLSFDSLRRIGENHFAVQGRYGGLVDARGNWHIRTRLTSNFD